MCHNDYMGLTDWPWAKLGMQLGMSMGIRAKHHQLISDTEIKGKIITFEIRARIEGLDRIIC